jgi:drug/metabolite transporter (DMT)-like permease
MNYIVFAWIASFVYGMELIIGKLTSKYTVSNPWLLNFVWSFFIILLIAPFAFANNVGISQFTSDLLWASLYYALSNILYIITLQLMDITAFGPLFHFRTVFAVLLGVSMLGEQVTGWQIFLIGFIFLFGILSNVDEKLKWKAFFRPAILVAMSFLFVLALMGIYINKAIAEQGYWNVTFWSMVIAQVLSLITVPFFWKDALKTKLKNYSGLVWMSVASAGATLAANQAYATNVGISSAIISLPFSSIIAIILSRVNPKLLEHHTAKVYAIRIIAAVVMLIAALQLSK